MKIHIIVDQNGKLVGVFKQPGIDSTIHKVHSCGKEHVLQQVAGLKEQLVIDNYQPFASRTLP